MIAQTTYQTAVSDELFTLVAVVIVGGALAVTLCLFVAAALAPRLRTRRMARLQLDTDQLHRTVTEARAREVAR